MGGTASCKYIYIYNNNIEELGHLRYTLSYNIKTTQQTTKSLPADLAELHTCTCNPVALNWKSLKREYFGIWSTGNGSRVCCTLCSLELRRGALRAAVSILQTKDLCNTERSEGLWRSSCRLLHRLLGACWGAGTRTSRHLYQHPDY